MKLFLLAGASSALGASLCDHNPCHNNCECVQLDQSPYNPFCAENCDYQCKNIAGNYFLGKNCQYNEVHLQCDTDRIRIYVNQDSITHHQATTVKVQDSLFQTQDEACDFHKNGDWWVLDLTKKDFGKCGNRVRIENGELAVENTLIYSEPTFGGSIEPLFVSNPYAFSWKCRYQVSVNYAQMVPVQSPATPISGISGLYGNNDFALTLEFFNHPPTFASRQAISGVGIIPVGEFAWVKAKPVWDNDLLTGQDVAISFKKCFVTNGQDKNSNLYESLDIIEENCPVSDFADIVSVGKHAEFKLTLFKWAGVFDNVVVFCNVDLCSGDNCSFSRNCNTRRRRSAVTKAATTNAWIYNGPLYVFDVEQERIHALEKEINKN